MSEVDVDCAYAAPDPAIEASAANATTARIKADTADNGRALPLESGALNGAAARRGSGGSISGCRESNIRKAASDQAADH